LVDVADRRDRLRTALPTPRGLLAERRLPGGGVGRLRKFKSYRLDHE
jgi:hypothetical protein